MLTNKFFGFDLLQVKAGEYSKHKEKHSNYKEQLKWQKILVVYIATVEWKMIYQIKKLQYFEKYIRNPKLCMH